MKRTLPVIGLALATTVGIAGLTTAASGAASSHPSRAGTHTQSRGGPGQWTKVTAGAVSNISTPSLARTGDGDLHLIYTNKDGSRIRHTSIHTNGTIGVQNDVLASDWATTDYAPVVLGGDGANLRVVFGGMQSVNPGFWSDGRMYTATSVNAGSGWTLPAQAVGISHSAMSSYGTAGTTLADGTPIAAFPLNSTLTWHVGTGSNADQTQTVASCCVYDAAMVRDGSNVWMAWYGNGSTDGTNGVFAMQIYPTVGSVLKAPGSSKTSLGSPASDETGRIGLAARAGGGVYAAYCVGYPTCTSVRIWKVGTTTTKDVPGSKGATHIALSAGPSGRLWVAWSGPKVRAVRTGEDGLAMGAVRNVGLPAGQDTAYSLAIDGSRGRGDIVVNVGSSLWHTQVLAGLTLGASPLTWQHGHKQRVVFTVTDAHAAIDGARVKVGTLSCKTGSKGTCAITFPGSFGTGKHTARASKSGYAAATTGLRVK